MAAESYPGEVVTRTPLVERAVRLFEFLGRAQQLKSRPPRTVDAHPSVLWLGELPRHLAVGVPEDPQPDDPVLVVDRIARSDPPPVDGALQPWLDGPTDDPGRPPQLRSVPESSAPDSSDSGSSDSERPDLDGPFAAWLDG